MSKTTFFKRIALTAIAALGFGMLSVAPSQANITSLTVTTTNGTATVLNSDSRTAATLNFSFLALGSQVDGLADSFVVTIAPAAAFPTGADITGSGIFFTESSTSVATRTPTIDSGTANTTNANGTYNRRAAIYDSGIASGFTGSFRVVAPAHASTANGVFGATVKFSLGETTSSVIVAGTYSYNAIVTSVQGGVSVVNTYPFNIVVADTPANVALASGTVDPSKTTAVLNAGTGTTASTDASISEVATSASTVHGTIAVRTYNSSSLATPESITVTVTGPGLVGDGSTFGKSVVFTGAGGVTNIQVRADGTAGVASIVVATTTVTFPAKNVTFYAVAPSTVSASVNKPVISVGTNSDVVRATFKDANGNIWGGPAYIAATDDAVAGDEDGVECTFSTTNQRHECPISGSTKGTTTFKVWNSSDEAVADDEVAAADAAVTSDALSVRVSTGVASSVVLSFDKATYAPGEKAQLRVSVLDGEGLAMPGVTITNALASGGITTASAFGTGSDTTTAVSFALSGSTSAAANTNAGHKTYVVYMPATAGVVTVSATGGTGIAAAGRVALTASATVVDTSNDAAIAASEAAQDAAAEAIDAANAATDAANLAAEAADAATVAAEEARDAADAATAAVEALATEVATLMAALKAQITTLANTVAKIAKKVKA